MKSRLLTTTAALSVALSTFQPLPLVAQEGREAVCAQNPDLCPPKQKRGEGAQKREQAREKQKQKEERPAARAAQQDEGEAPRARRANREQAEEGGQARRANREQAEEGGQPRRPAAEQDAPARGEGARARAPEAEEGAARAQAEGNAADDTRLLEDADGQGEAARPAKRARPAEEERPADRERAGNRAARAGAAEEGGAARDAGAAEERPPAGAEGRNAQAREAAPDGEGPDAEELRRRLEGDAPAGDRPARGNREGGRAADEDGGRNAEGRGDGQARDAEARGDGQARDAEGRDAERPRNRAAEGRDADRERNRNAEEREGDRNRPTGAQAREGEGRQQAGDEARRARQQQPEPEEARKSLARILESEDQGEEAAAAAAASAEDAGEAARQARRQANRAQRITEENSRSSNEEFRTLLDGNRDERNDDNDDDDGGLSNFEKFGLLALGGLAVGTLLNNNRGEVVSNSGDRVVVQRSDGTYSVLKDDDTLLRRPGSEVVTQSFDDGSTRSVVTRADGTQIVTIRDASGRVLRRTAVDGQGREVMLIDDLEPYQSVDVSRLPEPAPIYSFVETRDDQGLREALEQSRTRDLDRTYSLRQIREYREVRALAPAIDVDQITFETGSAAIDPDEAEKLASLGQTIADMIAERPDEVFLIEGHTDAVGDAASNLALSDRRAESVALALTEYFDVPPENMVVQGYGEEDLRVDSDGSEQRNRRVAVRLITPLMQTASN
ncbi:OmpA family protein [Cereibacter johrii]|uniref:OmpA family protein n=2 Tax=Cereibacter johrii TaxID=445629 RepID=A0ABX5JBZ6_9RHOB|nr:OmpA family protein [Cereibacter johrii]PTM81363.1 OmpA family protein [Cereibacter johrii]